jgi:hypothetical protein
VIVQVLLSPAFISPVQSAENVPPSNSTPGGVGGANSVTSYCPGSIVTTVPAELPGNEDGDGSLPARATEIHRVN